MVADAEPEAILLAGPFVARHAFAFLNAVNCAASYVEAEFDAINVLEFKRSFRDYMEQTREIIGGASRAIRSSDYRVAKPAALLLVCAGSLSLALITLLTRRSGPY